MGTPSPSSAKRFPTVVGPQPAVHCLFPRDGAGLADTCGRLSDLRFPSRRGLSGKAFASKRLTLKRNSALPRLGGNTCCALYPRYTGLNRSHGRAKPLRYGEFWIPGGCSPLPG